MLGHEDVKVAAKIVFIYVAISSFFSLLGRLNTLIDYNLVGVKLNVSAFFTRNTLWIVFVVIILGLGIYYFKNEGKVDFSFIRDPFIRLLSGILVICDGLINLSTKLPISILSISSGYQVASVMTDKSKELIVSTILTNSILGGAVILQILFGVYFVFSRKKNKSKSTE